jgi:cobalt-zinc-cadmium efflux system outer membrane protein
MTSPALRALIEHFLAEHPAVQAAQADLKRAEAEARALGQPLYNPELELEYEDATDITKSIGVSQTFDWSGKRHARDRASAESMRAASATLAAARQELIAELLEKLSNVTFTAETARLSRQRVELLEEFVALAQRRYAAGDVGQSDVDLAHLALSEASMQSATLTSDAAEAESRLTALIQPRRSAWPPLPALPLDLSAFQNNTLLERHPVLRQAEAEAAAAKANVSVSQRDRRADPTLGLHGGQEADDTLVRLTVSIPLFVRNTYRAEVDSANADALRAEQAYRNHLRHARGELQAAATRYRALRTALQNWENSGQQRLKGRIALLKRLWEAGEIGTTDYLVQLQQTLDTQVSAAALRGEVWEAWIRWLTTSGQIEYWLGIQTDTAS